jgi:hypothetical protein
MDTQRSAVACNQTINIDKIHRTSKYSYKKPQNKNKVFTPKDEIHYHG